MNADRIKKAAEVVSSASVKFEGFFVCFFGKNYIFRKTLRKQ